MCNSTSSRFRLNLPFCTHRFIRYFLATVAVFFTVHLIQEYAVSAQTVKFLSYNDENGDLSRSLPDQSFTITPLSIICVVLLVLVLIFLLQPIYVYFSQAPNPPTITPMPLLHVPALSTQVLNTSPLHHLSSHQFPSIDRLVFTDQSIVSTTFHARETVAEIQLLPLGSRHLTQLIERSMAEVIVLMGNHTKVDSLDMMLGIRHLWDHHLDAVKPKSLSPEIVPEKDDDSENAYPELYQFLNIRLSAQPRDMASSIPYPATSTARNLLDPSIGNSNCYIVRRSVLLSLLKRWEWSRIDGGFKHENIQVERLYTVIGMS